MKLADYLSERKVSTAEFAERVGVTSEAVRLWVIGRRQPSGSTMRRIVNETGGAVQPNDFFEIPKAPVVSHEAS